MSNRPKSKHEQFLSDYLGKIGQDPGETGTIEVDAIAALGRIEHELDEITAQRDELIEVLELALARSYQGCLLRGVDQPEWHSAARAAIAKGKANT